VFNEKIQFDFFKTVSGQNSKIVKNQP
jgi:hypothetical protein